MTTSNTYDFAPTITDLTLEAFERILLQPNQLTVRHMHSARISANFVLQSWANRGVNLWAVDLQEVPLEAEEPTYVLNPATQNILDAYISITDANGAVRDYPITPMGRTEYADISRKADTGRPTQYWFERLIAPQITLWLVPDDIQTYTLKFYRMRRLQDAAPVGGQGPDIHYRFTDAFAAALAARLAEKFAPAMLNDKISLAMAAWREASSEDNEHVDMHMTPDLTGYFIT